MNIITIFLDYVFFKSDIKHFRFRNCEETEWLWRLARVLCEKGKLCKNDEEKKRLFKEALEFADKALKNEPVSGCSAAHKWFNFFDYT